MLTTQRLEQLIEQVMPVAEREGLDIGRVHFELVDGRDLPALAAYQGLPLRYSHWSFGKSYSRLKTQYDFRASRIYELVINHHPYFAFLDRSTGESEALLIIAHVLAHVDFFENSRLFWQTDRKMLHTAAQHAHAIQRARIRYGEERVETLIEAALVVADYCGGTRDGGYPGHQTDDLIGFIAGHSPILQDWERDVLLMIRREAQYFWPQAISKISNEGYAAFWHTRIVRNLSLSATQSWELAALNAKLLMVQSPQLNPYGLGRQLYEDIMRRNGRQGVFEARDFLDDAGLVRNSLTPAIVEQQHLGAYRDADSEPQMVSADFECVSRQLVKDLDHAGLPHLQWQDPSGGGLDIMHHYDGRTLDFFQLPYAMRLIATRLWGQTVRLHTMKQGIAHVVSHDGTKWTDEIS